MSSALRRETPERGAVNLGYERDDEAKETVTVHKAQDGCVSLNGSATRNGGTSQRGQIDQGVSVIGGESATQNRPVTDGCSLVPADSTTQIGDAIEGCSVVNDGFDSQSGSVAQVGCISLAVLDITQETPAECTTARAEDGVTSTGHSPTADDERQALKNTANRHRWLVLMAAFLCRMLGEGYANSMGIFFVEFLEYFQFGRGITGWAVSLTTGVMYGAGIPMSFIVRKTNERIACMAGALISCAGLLSTYFATSVFFVLFTFGIVTGVGMSLIQISYPVTVGRNFQDSRGPATAVCEMGVTIGGMIFPVLLRYLIDVFGWRGAVLISAGILLNMMAMGILFSSPRPVKTKGSQPDPGLEEEKTKNAETFSKQCQNIRRTRAFIVYVIVAAVVGVGCFFPYSTIVDLGNLQGYGKEKSTYLLMILSVANTVGVALMAGLLKLFWRHVSWVYTCNIFLLGVSLCMFPLASSYGTLVLTIICFGLPSGGLYGSYAVVVIELLGMEHYTIGLGFACSGYGIGMALSTPVAGWINEGTGDYQKSFFIAGSICVGAALMFGITLLAANVRRKSSCRSADLEMDTTGNTEHLDGTPRCRSVDLVSINRRIEQTRRHSKEY